ncbi:hypothetical protein KHA80_21630 [Anaerobacillus sp. HL2]|nr:hypothetical protein KHA80_21630 [Anaerobacillus sp. HL2]
MIFKRKTKARKNLELEELEKSLNITSREAKRFHEECLEVEKRINELDSQIHYLQDDEAHMKRITDNRFFLMNREK